VGSLPTERKLAERAGNYHQSGEFITIARKLPPERKIAAKTDNLLPERGSGHQSEEYPSQWGIFNQSW